jgi:hypothetical protein
LLRVAREMPVLSMISLLVSKSASLLDCVDAM